jgi:hypothetical protein
VKVVIVITHQNDITQKIQLKVIIQLYQINLKVIIQIYHINNIKTKLKLNSLNIYYYIYNNI